MADRGSLLLVEGISDRHAVLQLVRLAHNADPAFDIQECGSDDRVLSLLAARMVSSEVRQKALGVVLDADIEGAPSAEVVGRRLQQIADRVAGRYDLPAAFPRDGLVVDPIRSREDAARLPRLGVWLMPDNNAKGMLEDLLVHSLNEDIRLYVARVVEQAKGEGIATYRQAHHSKAVVRTYMAWQDPPDVPYLGVAIQKGVFGNIQSECEPFLRWIERLFGSSAAAGLG